MEKTIDIKAGMVFRNNTYERKCTIVNVFFDGDEEVITWKYWSVRKQRKIEQLIKELQGNK